jgi:hypothetical protein
MELWDKIEAVVDRFAGTEEERSELRVLASAIPRVEEVPTDMRSKAQELAAQALYKIGDLTQVLEWAIPPANARVALWAGFALFDLARYHDAVTHLRNASAAPLQDWARAKVAELMLCCEIRTGVGSVTIDRFQRLHETHQSLGEHAPIPEELHTALREARAAGLLDPDLVEAAEKMFAQAFADAGLAGAGADRRVPEEGSRKKGPRDPA